MLVFSKIHFYKCHVHRPSCPKGRTPKVGLRPAWRERSVAEGVQSKRSEACPAIEDRVEGNPLNRAISKLSRIPGIPRSPAARLRRLGMTGESFVYPEY